MAQWTSKQNFVIDSSDLQKSFSFAVVVVVVVVVIVVGKNVRQITMTGRKIHPFINSVLPHLIFTILFQH